MIELTTGVAFLLSSMYGSGNVNADTNNQANASQIETAPITVEIDKTAIERYVRTKYSDTPILAEIAKCESEFSQFDKYGQVVRGRVNKADVGIMQINEKYHLDTAKKLGYNIYSVEGNVAYGKYLYDKYGTEPWSASSKCWGDKSIAMK